MMRRKHAKLHSEPNWRAFATSIASSRVSSTASSEPSKIWRCVSFSLPSHIPNANDIYNLVGGVSHCGVGIDPAQHLDPHPLPDGA